MIGGAFYAAHTNPCKLLSRNFCARRALPPPLTKSLKRCGCRSSPGKYVNFMQFIVVFRLFWFDRGQGFVCGCCAFFCALGVRAREAAGCVVWLQKKTPAPNSPAPIFHAPATLICRPYTSISEVYTRVKRYNNCVFKTHVLPKHAHAPPPKPQPPPPKMVHYVRFRALYDVCFAFLWAGRGFCGLFCACLAKKGAPRNSVSPHPTKKNARPPSLRHKLRLPCLTRSRGPLSPTRPPQQVIEYCR
jgi:hypothetical protein